MAGACALLLLAALPAVVAGNRPNATFLGGLFPIVKLNGAVDGGGRRRLAAFLLALDHINDHTDGLWDDLLPETRVQFAVGDRRVRVVHRVGCAGLSCK